MDGEDDRTSDLLKRWHSGDPEGIQALLERHLPWIRDHVRRRVGPMLRGKGEISDYVQDAMVELLRYGPRFHVSDEGRFRVLMARLIDNGLRDKWDWFKARRRDIARERPLAAGTILELDPPRTTTETPSRILMREEREAWIRFGIELLAEADREVIILRQWDRLAFEAIGERLEISAEAARKRFSRALGRLGDIVDALRQGKIDSVIEEASSSEAGHDA